MPLLRDLPSGGGETNIENVGNRQSGSWIGLMPKTMVLGQLHVNVGGWPVIVGACKRRA